MLSYSAIPVAISNMEEPPSDEVVSGNRETKAIIVLYVAPKHPGTPLFCCLLALYSNDQKH